VDGQRQKNAGQNAELARSEEAGLFDESYVDGAESRSQRLHSEGETVKDGTNYEAGKRKGEWMPKQARC
jgi:hypothetical protein